MGFLEFMANDTTVISKLVSVTKRRIRSEQCSYMGHEEHENLVELGQFPQKMSVLWGSVGAEVIYDGHHYQTHLYGYAGKLVVKILKRLRCQQDEIRPHDYLEMRNFLDG